MGKIKKTRSRPPKELVPEEVEESELELGPSSSQENVIETVMDQLQAPNIEEKYCGLQSLATVIEDPVQTEEILSSTIIKAVAPLLVDSIASIRNSAAGVLNNLSQYGYEVCVAMIEQDVMTPLIAYFDEHAPKLDPKPKSKKFDEETESFKNCISLLLNLCENSGRALKYFNMSRILLVLLRFLDFEVFGYEISISVLQFLFVVSEDNIATTERMKRECEGKLETILQLEGNEHSIHLLRTLGAGVIINCCGGDIASLPADTINKIMSVLSNTLSVDHRQACNQLSSAIPVSNGGSKVKALKGREGQALESQIKSVTQLLNAQQTSTEIIANIFSCEDGEDSVVADDSSDSEEMIDENLTDQSENNESLPILDKLPPEVFEAMASYEIYDKIWSKTILPPDNTMQILREYESSRNLCQVAANLQSRSLLCMNNMITSLPLSHLGGVSSLYKTWVAAGKYVFAPNSSDDGNLVESATAVMRSALCRVKAERDGADDLSGIRDLSLSDVEVLLSGAKACTVVEARSNLIRMLGSLALLLTRSPAALAADVLALITGFVLEQAHRESEVWVVAECVDTLLDLYAEDETDALAARTQLVDKLSQIAPVLKNKARQQRKQLGEHAVLVHTATSNLPRFIKYKRDRIAQLPRQ